nr:glutathione S-transferase sigma1 [Phyllotreta striolata]
MPSNFKLIYYNLTGRGEPIRMLLTYGGVPFEDNRFEWDDWPKIKPTTPLGQVPVLEIDGKRYTQTIPLCRYLGRMLKLDGKDDMENLAIDSAVEILWDVLKVAYERNWETSDEKKKQLDAKLHTLSPLLLGKLEEDVKRNGGFIALNRITWADIVFLCSYEDMMNLVPEKDPFEGLANLRQLKNKLLENENLREYIKKRPVNKMMNRFSLISDL